MTSSGRRTRSAARVSVLLRTAVSLAGVAVLLAAVPAAMAGCTRSGDKDGKVNLTVATFGEFGYEPLYKEYEAAHANVTITQQKADYNPHHEQIAQRMAAGAGLADVLAIEEGFIVQYRAQPQNFVNLFDHGAASLKSNFPDWKWDLSLSPDGKSQIGLGTDVGGLALCYRHDLLTKAGLPADRDELAKRMATWDQYIALGQEFVAKSGGVKWVDAATNTFNTILMQQGDHTYFDRSDKFVMESNPTVKSAWDTTMKMIAAGVSANLTAFQAEWNAGFQQGKFATIACPAWMMAYIQTQAPDTSGKWDITTIPGGGGNWGGSHLTVPKQSKHQKEAVELAKWLTAPEQQLRVFKDKGNLPSASVLYDRPDLQNFTNDFFNKAPVGKLFTAGAKNLKPVYLGKRNGPVRQAVENAMRAVEQGQLTADAAWRRALEDGKREAG